MVWEEVSTIFTYSAILTESLYDYCFTDERNEGMLNLRNLLKEIGKKQLWNLILQRLEQL